MIGPTRLASIQLSNVITGATGTVDLRNTPTPAGVVDPINGPFAHLVVLNESSTGLDFMPSQTPGAVYPAPAGRPSVIQLARDEISVAWVATYTVPTSYTETCYVYFYPAGEPVPAFGSVGGSSFGNQPRVIALGPTPPDDHGNASIAVGASSDTNLQQFLNTSNIQRTWSLFLYWLSISVVANAVFASQYHLAVQTRTSGGVTTSTQPIAIWYNGGAANTVDRWILPISASPKKVTVFDPAGTADRAVLVITNDGFGLAGSNAVFWDIGWSIGRPGFLATSPGTHGAFILNGGPF